LLDLPLLLAQLLVVLSAARVAGQLARLLGQPEVVGEMAAGLALGPALFGTVAPQAFASLFPARSLAPLATLSQLGVLLFMFVVGLRLDMEVLRGRTRAAVLTSNASIVLPFALGLVVAKRLGPEFVGATARGPAFALFVAAAMSVTAFPVLARILTERGLLGTRVGAVAIASAAVDDVSAWCVLAVVFAVAHAGDGLRAGAAALAGVAAYAGATALLARPLLRRAFATPAGGEARPAQVGFAVLVALASALATEALGVHALFGAFLAGAVMPRPGIARSVADRLDAAVTTVLLPIFFAFSGLRANVGSVSGAGAWGAFLLVLAAAVVGKAGGSTLAARATGLPWREAFSVGALMNTRGLVELAILNVGLDAGVISPALFGVMALMALTTTAMAAPLLALAGIRATRVAVS
jgi:Kef-type K+ transport system membrane component KefB